MRSPLFAGLLLAAVSLTGGCKPAAPTATTPAAPSAPGASTSTTAAPSTAVLDVVAVNTPLAVFAKLIGGDLVDVTMPVPADRDPAFWSPRAADVERMQKAAVIILNGAGHEKWRASTSLPESRVVDSADRFKSQWIETSDGVTHSHGVEGAHTHKGVAFTTWIDPSLAVEQADAIRAAFAKARPDAAATFMTNYTKLKAELESIDRELESAIHNQQSLPIVVSHPVYDYLIRRFALNARTVHWEPNEMPPADEWDALAALLKEHPARWMVWEDSPSDAIRAKLLEHGVECVVFRPAGNLGPGAKPDEWLAVQRENARELARVYE
ncbi:MAG: zinc ABC transporter substrate-binding protein [Phycisphaerae bacterium]|nr:zinc ABC transporter substrate-binding protein [Phycisphaerae bacterium]